MQEYILYLLRMQECLAEKSKTLLSSPIAVAVADAEVTKEDLTLKMTRQTNHNKRFTKAKAQPWMVDGGCPKNDGFQLRHGSILLLARLYIIIVMRKEGTTITVKALPFQEVKRMESISNNKNIVFAICLRLTQHTTAMRTSQTVKRPSG